MITHILTSMKGRMVHCLLTMALVWSWIAGSVEVRTQLAEEAALDPSGSELTFDDEITVGLSTVVVRVFDRRSEPVSDLQLADFRVRVDRATVPLVAAEWVSGAVADEFDLESITSLDDIVASAAPSESPSRFVVFFVQTDFNAPRRRGHRHVLNQAVRLPRSLHPQDWASVVFFDSHLKLWLDFTRQRSPIEEALRRSVLFGGQRVERPERDTWPSLARHFDGAAAKAATSPERGLELVARALEPFPGPKVLIYIGWGLGRHEGRAGVRMTPEYDPAVDALIAADTTVFVLDASYADFHSLEVGLQQIADDTGGLYFRGFRFPESAVNGLVRSIAGYYLLTLDSESLPRDAGRLRIDVPGRKGLRVHARTRWRPPETETDSTEEKASF